MPENLQYCPTKFAKMLQLIGYYPWMMWYNLNRTSMILIRKDLQAIQTKEELPRPLVFFRRQVFYWSLHVCSLIHLYQQNSGEMGRLNKRIFPRIFLAGKTIYKAENKGQKLCKHVLHYWWLDGVVKWHPEWMTCCPGVTKGRVPCHERVVIRL